ncbi:cohesin domain-containing protein [Alteromonas stellipolaris]|uniref:cohesin domain-containing protein n=1 Tax=Alteromonas stellipolaris TaxID=233316 RepID=UPI0026E17928|nr:cohesin domain-containing protein [Alteromonas stellipolaris]MDO6537292.1 cohesin domain-containing protein [Alteromonas stellipolaris]
MKKLFTFITLLIGFQAQAGLISIELDTSNVIVGDTVEVSVIGTGFTSFDTLSLDIAFDTDLFELDALSIGGDLYDSLPFIFNVTPQAFGVAVAYLDFVAFSGGDFTIVRFNVNALDAGQSNFNMENIIAAEFVAGELDVAIGSGQASATVNAVNVIAPNTLSIILMVAITFMGVRRFNR